MYHSLGQPTVDLTRFPCVESALCQSGGDPSLICCGNLPGAAGGTCMTRTACTQAGYSERQAPALPALPGAQEEAPSIWENATAQIVVGVVVAVGVALTLNYLSGRTGQRYANNPKTAIASQYLIRYLSKEFGLTSKEAKSLAIHPKHREIIERLDKWRGQHGYPAPNSPLSRGKLLELMRSNHG